MAMQRLSKEAEGLIVDALDSVQRLVDSGLSPNDAIVKVAKENNITDGHVGLMVYAYNTAQHAVRRKQASDSAGRAESFPLADQSTIISELYPSEVKKGSATSDIVSSEYSIPPRLNKSSYSVPMQKAASAPLQSTRRIDDAAYIYGGIQKLRNKCSEAHLVMTNHRQKLDGKMTELNEYFRRTPSVSFKEAFDNACILHGLPAEALRESILEARPELAKQAFNSPLAPAVGRPYTTIEECINLANQFFAARAAYEQTVKVAEAERIELLKPLDALLPKKAVADGPIDLSKLNTQDSCDERGLFSLYPFAEKEAWGIPVATAAKYTMANATVRKLLEQMPGMGKQQPEPSVPLISPTHAAELRNVQLEAMLSDLMSNDPNIQGAQDPDEILDAYNEISHLAPRAAGEKGVARTFLRRRLTKGHLDEFDLKNLMDLEKTIAITGGGGIDGITNPLLSEAYHE